MTARSTDFDADSADAVDSRTIMMELLALQQE
jgi:hypothetical protein